MARLGRRSAVLDPRDHRAAGQYTVAAILIAEALRAKRLVPRLEGHRVLARHVSRLAARPAFAKAYADQMAHFAAADAARAS
ncbi:MAG: hypothetical protein MUD11_05565 [Rhodobacteraceae bacterium]|jgi:glutathione S-transferase|nr:hypothetical protein [Paracoccaceae bacterium]